MGYASSASAIPTRSMEPAKPAKPRVFIDADVLFAGAASPNEYSASNLIQRMAELTLI